MAKKAFGKLAALLTIAGAAAAGISYLTKYRSFNKELDESAFLVSIPMMDGKPLAADESQKFLFQYEEGEENRIVAY